MDSELLSKLIALIMSFISILSSLFGGFRVQRVDYIVYSDLSYSHHERNTLDLYVPEDVDEEKSKGVIVFIPGADWVSGDKSEYAESCKKYANEGYITAALNYRYIDLSEGVSCFGQLDDISAALAFIKLKSAQFGYDISKAALEGQSAGAHLAMLYAYSRDPSPLDIAFVGNRVGVTTLSFDSLGYESETDPEYLSFLSAATGMVISKNASRKAIKAAAESVSPLTYIGGTTVPTICAYGALDNIVMPVNREALLKSLDIFGVSYDYICFSNSGHTLAHDPDSTREYNKCFDNYLKFYLCNG